MWDRGANGRWSSTCCEPVGAQLLGPLCAPSRFSMLAGLLPSRIGAYDNGAGDKQSCDDQRLSINAINSARVLLLRSKLPRIALVIVELFCFCTPRIIMQV